MLQTSPGSVAYAKLTPSTPPIDFILDYQLNLIHHTPTTSICESWGYLYRQQSGLCLTATVNSTTSTSSVLFQRSHVALEPCANLMFGSELLLVVGGVGLDRVIASGCRYKGTTWSKEELLCIRDLRELTSLHFLFIFINDIIAPLIPSTSAYPDSLTDQCTGLRQHTFNSYLWIHPNFPLISLPPFISRLDFVSLLTFHPRPHFIPCVYIVSTIPSSHIPTSHIRQRERRLMQGIDFKVIRKLSGTMKYSNVLIKHGALKMFKCSI